MRKICWSCFKYIVLASVTISSSIAIFANHNSARWDPVREIKKLEDQNRRDDALDLAKFYKENQTDDSGEFAEIEKDLKYTTAQKFISFTWNGVVKGEVFDSYSGLGAVSADLCLFGDIRDLCIQSWKYLVGAEDYDKLITILSGAGIGLSSTTFLNGTNALAKNTIKYLKKVPATMNRGLLKTFHSGKLSAENCKKIWQLFKKTSGPCLAPYPASAIFLISNISTLHQIS